MDKYREAVLFIFAIFIFNACSGNSSHEEDPYLWLEDIEGEKALAWVESKNTETLNKLQNFKDYESFYEKNLTINNSKERIAYPSMRGDYIYNFWQDETNEKGVWRRMKKSDYLRSYHIPGPIVILIAGLQFPPMLIAAVIIFAGSRWYYPRRFGVDYPRVGF